MFELGMWYESIPDGSLKCVTFNGCFFVEIPFVSLSENATAAKDIMFNDVKNNIVLGTGLK